jgi:hypothetical protein
MKVFIDNIPLQYPNDSLLKPKFTLRKRDENNEAAFSFTGDLEFEGADADYIYNKLVLSPTALENNVILKFVDDCCEDKEYLFQIKPESLKWCDDFECKLTAAASEYSVAEQQLNCIKNTLIWDDYAGFQSKQHPRFSYCNELRPNWMHDVLIILFIATGTSILVLAPIIIGLVFAFNTINTVINLLNTLLPSGSQINNITLGGNPNIDFADLQNYYNILISFMVGCGRKHPSPLVRDYASNVCGKCGLTFVSSILNNSTSDYYNLCYVNAPIHKGTIETDNTTYWIDENKPLLNGFKYFEQIKTIFNAEWEIVGNQLIFEREDFFVPKTPWLDLTTYDPDKIIDVCWNWSTKPRYSYGNFEYIKDSINEVGGEARDRWNDIVEWNNPYSNLQKDEFHPFFEFAACRFRDDGIDRDVLSSYQGLPTIGPMIKKYNGAMLMNSHKSFQPMLLIWDVNSGVQNAKVNPGAVYFAGYPGVGLNQFYNYPMWFDATHAGNLYDRFWFIKNPRYAGWKNLEFEAKIIFDCDTQKNVDLSGTIITSKGPSKKITSVEIDKQNLTMVIKGSL